MRADEREERAKSEERPFEGTRKDVRAELDVISGRYSTLFIQFTLSYLKQRITKGEQRKKTD